MPKDKNPPPPSTMAARKPNKIFNPKSIPMEGGGPQGEVAEEVVAARVDPIPQAVEKRRQQPPNRRGRIRHGSLRGSAGSLSLQGC